MLGSKIIDWLCYCRRLCATALSFMLFGIGGALIPLLAYPLISFTPISEERKQALARRLIQKTFRFFVSFMTVTGVLTWETQGLEKLRRRGLLVLANHPTLLDVVFLVAFLPNADCIVKSQLRYNPAMRGFIKLTGFIVNDKGPELIEGTQRSLDKGSALVIFPEGTRTTPGEPVKFQRGAVNIALRTQTDITPMHIHCQPLALSKQHKWYHTADQRLHYRFSVGDDIAIAPYLEQTISLAARQLNRDVEQYFNKDL